MSKQSDNAKKHWLHDLLYEAGLVKSKSEGKRLIQQGGVKVWHEERWVNIYEYCRNTSKDKLKETT